MPTVKVDKRRHVSKYLCGYGYIQIQFILILYVSNVTAVTTKGGKRERELTVD
jgi:hypothetical protein